MRRLLLAAAVLTAAALLGAPAMAAGKAAGCAAYTYSNGNSLCSDQPGSADRNCADIKHQVRVIAIGIDPWGLDRDRDGRACETYAPGGGHPAKPTTKPAPKPTTHSAKPSPSSTQGAMGSTTDNQGPALAKTGPRTVLLAAGGAGLALAGLAGLALAYRRRVRFHS